MTQTASIAAIRAVQAAAMQLTIACTEIVGPLSMAVSMPTAVTLGEKIPRKMKRSVDAIDRKEPQP